MNPLLDQHRHSEHCGKHRFTREAARNENVLSLTGLRAEGIATIQSEQALNQFMADYTFFRNNAGGVKASHYMDRSPIATMRFMLSQAAKNFIKWMDASCGRAEQQQDIFGGRDPQDAYNWLRQRLNDGREMCFDRKHTVKWPDEFIRNIGPFHMNDRVVYSRRRPQFCGFYPGKPEQ